MTVGGLNLLKNAICDRELIAVTSVCFRSVIKIVNINPYILVNARQAEQIKKGWRKPLPVRVRVNGLPAKPWCINLMPVGDGSFYLYLHGDIRKASNTKVGDAVDLELQFDEHYTAGPTHPMPQWFDAALEQNRLARHGWNALTPSGQKEILRYFSRLKSSEAKERNTQKAIHVLSGGKGRFLARSWNE